MQPGLTLAKLSLIESADHLVQNAGFLANLDSSEKRRPRRLCDADVPALVSGKMRVEEASDRGIQFRTFRRIHHGRIEIGHMILTFLDYEFRWHSRLQELLLHPHRIGEKQIACSADQECGWETAKFTIDG